MSKHPYTETKISEGLRIRSFPANVASSELIWHRDRENRIITVLEGSGWSLQVDGGLPEPLLPGTTHTIPREMWHRVLREDYASRLSIEIQEIDDASMMTALFEGRKKKKRRPGNPDYYKGGTKKSNSQMAREINKCAKEPRPKSCYDDWSADKTYRKANESVENPEVLLSELIENLIHEVNAEETLLEGLSKKVRDTLKKKAEKANMPLGALTGVYRKGLAAWLTGHRQGTPQHAWAMGRVNSFIRGGKARGVDKSEWAKVKKHRGK